VLGLIGGEGGGVEVLVEPTEAGEHGGKNSGMLRLTGVRGRGRWNGGW
jgi:hypothetical protein